MDDTLPDAIDKLMQSANPEYPVGQAKGPTAEIIAAISPLLTGGEVTAKAVATHLQKRKKVAGEIG